MCISDSSVYVSPPVTAESVALTAVAESVVIVLLVAVSMDHVSPNATPVKLDVLMGYLRSKFASMASGSSTHVATIKSVLKTVANRSVTDA